MINNSTGFRGHVKADCHEPDALEISHGQHLLLKTLCMQIGTQSHKDRMPVVHVNDCLGFQCILLAQVESYLTKGLTNL